MPRSHFARAAFGATIVAAITRIAWLDRLPGLNGDEAWYGANLQAIASGQPAFWMTPSGNPLNPLHSGPLALLLAVFQPAPWVLRAPETLWSIAAVACAFPVLRRSIGDRAASITALLLAASPVAMIYGRLGWDPSGSIFITLIALACALDDKPIAAALAGLFALVVHPTNVFFLPILASAWLPHAIRRRADATPRQRTAMTVAAGLLVLSGAIGLALILKSAASNTSTPLPSVAVAVSRITSPSIWSQFLIQLGRMLSGRTTITFVAGAPNHIIAGIGTAIAAFAVIAILIRPVRRRSPHDWLLAGTILASAVFMIVAGPGALDPGFERYALFLLVPFTVVLAIALDAWGGRIAMSGSGAVLAGLLAVSISGFFVPLFDHGGDAHETFRTGDMEPKAAVADYIRTHTNGSALVICNEWWSYWPLRFLLHDRPQISVGLTPTASFPPGVRERLPATPASANAIFVVLFEGNSEQQNYRTPVFTSRDQRGVAILNVFRVD